MMQVTVDRALTQAQEWLERKHYGEIRVIRRQVKDPGLNVGHWVYLIVGALVLLSVVAALLGPLKTSLASYAGNDTTFGPILQSILLILIGAAILMAFVAAFFARSGKKGGMGY